MVLGASDLAEACDVDGSSCEGGCEVGSEVVCESPQGDSSRGSMLGCLSGAWCAAIGILVCNGLADWDDHASG